MGPEINPECTQKVAPNGHPDRFTLEPKPFEFLMFSIIWPPSSRPILGPKRAQTEPRKGPKGAPNEPRNEPRKSPKMGPVSNSAEEHELVIVKWELGKAGKIEFQAI